MCGDNRSEKYDEKVLIEQAVSGIEVGCAILGNGSDLVVGEVDQIDLKHGFFRIHQEAQPEKGSENATVKVPADLPMGVKNRFKIQQSKFIRYLGVGDYPALICFYGRTGVSSSMK